MALAVLPAAVAQAATGTGYLREFGEGVVRSPSAAAIDRASGDVYVAAQNEQGVQEIFDFDASTGSEVRPPIDGAATPQGSFAELVGVAVDQQTHDVYALDRGRQEIDEFAPDGGYITQFGGPGEEFGTFPAADTLGGIAVDPTSGDVLVSNESNDVITRFTAAGEYVSQFGRAGSGDGEFYAPTGIAVNSSGQIYVIDSGNARVEKLEPTGGFVSTLAAGAPAAIAVNQGNGNVYIGDSGSSGDYGQPGAYHVLEYGPAGSLLDDFGYGSIAASTGIAFGESEGDLYVADREDGHIAVFGVATLPAATTGASSNDAASTVTLAGEVKPEGTETHYYFQYGASDEYGTEAPERPGILAPSATTHASTALTGLEPNTTYHYRLVATNAAGSSYGAEMMFTTKQIAPAISEESGTPTSSTEAELSGHITPNNLPTSYHFEYGRSATSYETNVPIPDGEAGASPSTVSEPITGLQPDTTYYYRLLATNQANNTTSTTYGEQGSFTTLPPSAVVTSLPATDITATSATLPGAINPAGSATEYTFEYEQGCTRLEYYYFSFCSRKQVPGSQGALAAGRRTVPVTTTFTGLKPNTRYFYDLVATNAGASANGEPREFTTLPQSPQVAIRRAAQITANSAVIDGTVNPNGVATIYSVEYGATTGYGQSAPTPAENLSSTGTEPINVSVELPGLQNGTTYHYRLVGTNAGGVTYGEDGTFTTTTPEIYPLAPAAKTGASASVAATTANLTGTVNPNGAATSYRVEYGTTTYYGSEVGGASAGSSSEPQGVAQEITALQPGTLYHWRLVANNAAGVSYGEDASFTTATAPPVVVTSTVTAPVKPATAPAKEPASVTTKAQKLAKALKLCRREKPKTKRAACERAARRRSIARRRVRSQ